MGKYGFESGKDDDELGSFQIKILVHIANELAEANRLKRIEIKAKVYSETMFDAADYHEYMKELEEHD